MANKPKGGKDNDPPFIPPPSAQNKSGKGGGGGEQSGGNFLRGNRQMKEYYIYDSEFRELKKTGAITTAFFAAGSAALGFAVNIHTGMTFAENVDASVKMTWTIYRNVAAVGAALCYLFAIIQALDGYHQVEQIKAQTSHGGEKYVAKPWYRAAMWGLIFAAGSIFGIIIGASIWR